ncbi:hypothetical protein [Siccirubricoccus sp. G192]|uniref:hypothetical protein n=1 Tax=Siccirubricoccus sp. G192 TaxID=2849651 RepID=UPI001C2BBAA6|nr:hypothetical protein [Siccirubricoccus sp. G192]MBV1799471.1 hypothetical protein [Siccirubricoccus sp. G192]
MNSPLRRRPWSTWLTYIGRAASARNARKNSRSAATGWCGAGKALAETRGEALTVDHMARSSLRQVGDQRLQGRVQFRLARPDLGIRQVVQQVVQPVGGDAIAGQHAQPVFRPGIGRPGQFGGGVAPGRLPGQPGADPEDRQWQGDGTGQQPGRRAVQDAKPHRSDRRPARPASS